MKKTKFKVEIWNVKVQKLKTNPVMPPFFQEKKKEVRKIWSVGNSITVKESATIVCKDFLFSIFIPNTYLSINSLGKWVQHVRELTN